MFSVLLSALRGCQKCNKINMNIFIDFNNI